jgi:hypothetical protein
VSSLVEAKTLADDYALTHKLIFLKNKKAGGVPNLNYVQNRPPSYNHFDFFSVTMDTRGFLNHCML